MERIFAHVNKYKIIFLNYKLAIATTQLGKKLVQIQCASFFIYNRYRLKG